MESSTRVRFSFGFVLLLLLVNRGSLAAPVEQTGQDHALHLAGSKDRGITAPLLSAALFGAAPGLRDRADEGHGTGPRRSWGTPLTLLTIDEAKAATHPLDVARASSSRPEAGSTWPGELATEEPETERETAWRKPVPLSFRIDYTMATDYIWRGINLSEYPGEGREKLNHQLGTGVEFETPIGTLGASVWFEWYAGQERLTPASSRMLQEVDYSVYWSYGLEPIATTLEIGWIAYELPRAKGDLRETYEVYGKLSLDDSIIFGVPLLSPYVYWGLDYDLGENGSWVEVGGSHEFAAADLEPLASVPVVKDLALTPSVAVGFDYRYLDKFAGIEGARSARRVANVVYGLDLGFDITGALSTPARYGNVKGGGFLNYSQGIRQDLLSDELYGGVYIAYEW